MNQDDDGDLGGVVPALLGYVDSEGTKRVLTRDQMRDYWREYRVQENWEAAYQKLKKWLLELMTENGVPVMVAAAAYFQVAVSKGDNLATAWLAAGLEYIYRSRQLTVNDCGDSWAVGPDGALVQR